VSVVGGQQEWQESMRHPSATSITRAPRATSTTARPRPRSLTADVKRTTVGLHALFSRWTRFHDEAARLALVRRFLPLARSLARRYGYSGVPLEDLEQVASLGLLKAIDRFEPARGLAFTSFAVPTILGELQHYLRDTSWAVHVPRGAQERAGKVEAAVRVLTSQTGRSPTVAELARDLGLTDEDVLDGLEIGQAHAAVSLDAPCTVDDDTTGSLMDVLEEANPLLALADTAASVSRAVEQLPKLERRILHLRFAEDLTQTEIARRIGISQVDVSRLLRRSVRRLQEKLTDKAQPLDTYR
jgi:RNA polymerase sigma-B factor